MKEDRTFAAFVILSLLRHSLGDWGEVSEQDQKENDISLKKGYRILSVYEYADGETIWIITEGDRSQTIVLFPEEY